MPRSTSRTQISPEARRQASPKPRTPRTPTYRRHISGRAVVTLSGKDHYLGPHGSPESYQKYDQAIAEWLSRGRRPAEPESSPLGVNQVLMAYLNWAKTYYRDRDGKPNERELCSVRRVLKTVRELFGLTPACDFDPIRLEAVRDRFVEEGLSRGLVNRYVNRIKHVFKKAVAKKLVDGAVWHDLTAVENLRRGHTDARECEPIRPVADHLVDAVRPHVSRQVWGLIELQRHTGMRPGEAVIMRGCDLDMAGPVWIYTPSQHKTEHHGHHRVVTVGPKAQAVIRPFLKRDLQAFLFSPSEAEDERRSALSESRKTPLSYGNRPGTNRKRRRRKQPGLRYTVASYRRAIHYGCDQADSEADEAKRSKDLPTDTPSNAERVIPRWSPNRIRHSFATRVRKQFGLDAAQVALGHAQANITQVYAEKDQQLAAQVALKIG